MDINDLPATQKHVQKKDITTKKTIKNVSVIIIYDKGVSISLA